MSQLNVADQRMYGLVALFDLHTQLFGRAIEDMSADDSNNRLGTKANHPSWIAGSLVQQRFEMASMLGMSMQQLAHDLFRDYQGIIAEKRYPPVGDYLSDWKSVSPGLRDKLAQMNENDLNSAIDMGPMKITQLEMITFMTYREASMIGQLALWRRLLDYPGIKYEDL